MDKSLKNSYTGPKTLPMKNPQKFRSWRCGCGKLLGLIYSDGVLAVKYKDLVAWVTGTYKTVCRFCRSINVYRTEKLEEVLDEYNKTEEVKKIG